MKKILFVLPSYVIGGTTVSTKNLLLLLDRKKFDISILALYEKGELKDFYEGEKIIKSDFWLRSWYISLYNDSESFFSRLISTIVRRLATSNYIFRSYLFKKEANKIERRYSFDIIISCQEGYTTEFVSFFKNPRKIAWVRSDYRRYLESSKRNEDGIYSRIDNIVCVSDVMKKVFVNYFPKLENRTFAIYNPQSTEFIMKQAEKNDNDIYFERVKHTIVSVGRVDPVKQFELIPEIAANLKNKGVIFKWYIIGGGIDLYVQPMLEKIRKYDVQDCVVHLGPKSNAHYYIKNADLLVSLSKSEACPRVINEAKILNTPVVCTDFETAKEYITDGEDGIICTIDEIADKIEQMMIDEKLYNKIESEITKFKFDNTIIINQIMKLLK